MPRIDELPRIPRAAIADAALIPVLQGGTTGSVTAANLVRAFQGFVDPHDFGAKGDLVEYADGVVLSDGSFHSPGHGFTESDLGKLIIIRTLARSVEEVVDDHTVRVAGGDVPVGEGLHWMMGTDDTAAINDALQAAATNAAGGKTGGTEPYTADKLHNHGWVVMLRSGHAYLVSNSQEDFDQGKLGAIVMRKRTGLMGASAGQTSIHFKPGSVGHVITQVKLDGTDFTEHLMIAHLTIRGHRDRQIPGKALAGIRLQQPARAGAMDVNPFHTIDHVNVFECMGSGMHFGGWGELIVSNCRSIHNNQYGYFIDGLVDSTFVACNAGGNQRTGFRISRGGANRYIGCKSYYSGQGGGSDIKDSANWAIYADQQANGFGFFVGCEAQESRGSAWVIENAGLCLFNGCIASDPGRSRLLAGHPPAVRAGFHLTGSGCRNNVFSDCMVQPSVQIWSNPNWTGTAAVHIDGLDAQQDGPQSNKGAIWTFLPTSGTQNGTIGTQYLGDKTTGEGTRNGANVLLRVDGVPLE